MYVTISARHCLLPDPVRHHAEERLRVLARFEPALIGVEVNFEVGHGVHRVESRLSVPGAPAIVARGAGEGFRTALDQAVHRLGRQLRNRRKRRREHRAARSSKSHSPAGGP